MRRDSRRVASGSVPVAVHAPHDSASSGRGDPRVGSGPMRRLRGANAETLRRDPGLTPVCPAAPGAAGVDAAVVVLDEPRVDGPRGRWPPRPRAGPAAPRPGTCRRGRGGRRWTSRSSSTRAAGVMVQGVDERFYRWWEPFDRLAAGAAPRADAVLAASTYLGTSSAAVRPDLAAHAVRSAWTVRCSRRPPRPRSDGPRALVSGQPSLSLKGVDDALAAVGAMREPVETTLVSLDPGCGAGLPVARVVAACRRPDGRPLRVDRRPAQALARRGPRHGPPRGGGGRDAERRDPVRRADGLAAPRGQRRPGDVRRTRRRRRGSTCRRGTGRRAAARRRPARDGAGWPTLEESADASGRACGVVERSRRPRKTAPCPCPYGRAQRRPGPPSFARRTGEGAHAERHLELLVSSTTYRLAERVRRAPRGVRAARAARGRTLTVVASAEDRPSCGVAMPKGVTIAFGERLRRTRRSGSAHVGSGRQRLVAPSGERLWRRGRGRRRTTCSSSRPRRRMPGPRRRRRPSPPSSGGRSRSTMSRCARGPAATRGSRGGRHRRLSGRGRLPGDAAGRRGGPPAGGAR